ncbi:MAG: hypothetical protein JM58_14385 [Peptococcaceae bacterium BICA1-8]|nr:MAG: hypothetical protein JM58_14385 [Peptococcaceae bacterium BICA1-8]
MNGLRLVENTVIAILIFTIGISVLFSFQIESNLELYNNLKTIDSQLNVMDNTTFNEESKLITNEGFNERTKFNKLFYLLIGGFSLMMLLNVKKEEYKVKLFLQFILLVIISLSAGVLLAVLFNN